MSKVIPNNIEYAQKFIDHIKKNLTLLAKDEFDNNHGQNEQSTIEQINESLKFMEYYKKFQKLFANTSNNIDNPVKLCVLNCSGTLSLFELFLSIYTNIYLGFIQRIRITSKNRKYLENYLKSFVEFENDNEFLTDTVVRSSYCTQIIFDSADTAVAFDQLEKSALILNDITTPWRIRTCWIQESIKLKFEQRFPSSLLSPSSGRIEENTADDQTSSLSTVTKIKDLTTKFGGNLILSKNSQRLPFLVGCTVDHINSDQIILVNYFRTAKDVIGLINKSVELGGCSCVGASIWTENLSLSYEVATKLLYPNIWLNSIGILNPSVPFTFGGCSGGGQQMYGSLLALCYSAIVHDDMDGNNSVTIDPKAGLAEYLDDNWTNGFSSFQIDDTGKFTLQTTSLPRKPNQLICVRNDVIVKNPILRQYIANIIFYQQKTIILPFGTIFAN